MPKRLERDTLPVAGLLYFLGRFEYSKARRMPKSWWGQTLMWGYTAGYCIDLGVAAVRAWPQMALMPWLGYLSEQSIYACLWPISIVRDVIGL